MKAGLPDDASQACTLNGNGYGKLDAKVGQVVMPYAGNIYTNASYLHLNQRAITNNL